MWRSIKLNLAKIILFMLLIACVNPLLAGTDTAIDDYLFQNNDLGVREGKRTDAAIVIKNGNVIYEKYARGYDSSKKHIL